MKLIILLNTCGNGYIYADENNLDDMYKHHFV